MKICIIGAGVSGMASARLLNKKHQVSVFEADEHIGGIAKTKVVAGMPYHMVGGHCFNSKHQSVLDFVFDEVLAKKHWHLVKRDARISFRGHTISYPIEYAIKEIANFDPPLAIEMVKDFICAQDRQADNLSQWFIEKFGTTLAQEYFIPYNHKIWHRSPDKMSPLWVDGKLPIPNKEAFISNLLFRQQDAMPHANFYYPNSNNQNTFLQALAAGLDIALNTKVTHIEKQDNGWLINKQYQFDHVISTMPLDKIPFVLSNTPSNIRTQAKKLKYNSITNMLWESEDLGSRTWTYYPEEKTIFHRHIHIGAFLKPRKNLTITESIGIKSYAQMLAAGQAIDYLKKPLDYHQSDYAYIVYDKNYQQATQTIKNYLDEIGLWTLGRFGEWQYYNMDMCIKSAMEIVKKIP